jgi:hypothetical protein
LSPAEEVIDAGQTTKDVHKMGDQPQAYQDARRIEVKQDSYVESYKAFLRLARKHLVTE